MADSRIKVISCEDITDQYNSVSNELLFEVVYVKDGVVITRRVRYSRRGGFSPDPEVAFLQKWCLEANRVSKYWF